MPLWRNHGDTTKCEAARLGWNLHILFMTSFARIEMHVRLVAVEMNCFAPHGIV